MSRTIPLKKKINIECFENGLCDCQFDTGKPCEYYYKNKWGSGDCKRRDIKEDNIRSRQTFNLKRQILALLNELQEEYDPCNQNIDTLFYSVDDFDEWKNKSKSNWDYYFSCNYPGTQTPILEHFEDFFELFEDLFFAKYRGQGWSVHMSGGGVLELYNIERYERIREEQRQRRLKKERERCEKELEQRARDLRRNRLENPFQEETCKMLEDTGCLLLRGNSRSLKGTPDFIVIVPGINKEGKIFLLEFKRPNGKGRLSDEQKTVKEYCDLGNIPYCVIESEEQRDRMIQEVREYMND